ncbi:MAG: hypothetical protein CMP31_04465 [Roseibacillus sp.]|nr:hypothetical protein [Roseibacillus sp.]
MPLAPVVVANELPRLTSLSDKSVSYKRAENPYVVIKRGDVEAVIVDNRPVDDEVLPKHRAGYSGVASLRHTGHRANLFVPSYAGLNFEHIHDGTEQDRKVLFEPRNAPMQLRVVDEHTVELYQAPTPHYKLESCQRYRMLEDGTIELTVECIPRAKTFINNYVGLFWASYIHRPQSLDIHFKGRESDRDAGGRWIRGITPRHGVLSTHLAADDDRSFPHEDGFPLTLVFNRSNFRYTEPWYYGVSHGMTLVLMFRSQDRIRFTQSPSGGGNGNPAWDFQCFFSDFRHGQRYQIIMRMMCVPFESREQIERVSAPHRKALGPAVVTGNAASAENAP